MEVSDFVSLAVLLAGFFSVVGLLEYLRVRIGRKMLMSYCEEAGLKVTKVSLAWLPPLRYSFLSSHAQLWFKVTLEDGKKMYAKVGGFFLGLFSRKVSLFSA